MNQHPILVPGCVPSVSTLPLQLERPYDVLYTYNNPFLKPSSVTVAGQKYQNCYESNACPSSESFQNPVFFPPCANFGFQPAQPTHCDLRQPFPIPSTYSSQIIVSEPFVALDQHSVYHPPLTSCVSYTNNAFQSTKGNLHTQITFERTSQCVKPTSIRCYSNSTSLIMPQVLQNVQDNNTTFDNRSYPSFPTRSNFTSGSFECRCDNPLTSNPGNVSDLQTRCRLCTEDVDSEQKAAHQTYLNTMQSIREATNCNHGNYKIPDEKVPNSATKKAAHSSTLHGSDESKQNRADLFSAQTASEALYSTVSNNGPNLLKEEDKLQHREKDFQLFASKHPMSEEQLLEANEEKELQSFAEGNSNSCSQTSVITKVEASDSLSENAEPYEEIKKKSDPTDSFTSRSEECTTCTEHLTNDVEVECDSIDGESDRVLSCSSNSEESYDGETKVGGARQVLSYCTFCLSLKLDYTYCRTHSIFNTNGDVMCPKLRRTKCSLCSALGHTAYFCLKRKRSKNRLSYFRAGP
uniref:Nanos-type domain-containing protein n=1 Tax=Syphacia muris TaxID=451379 RepID=A0A0N5AEF0_9BILA